MRWIYCFLLFYLFRLSNAINECECDERTTISVGRCTYTIDKNKYRILGGCECIFGFGRPQIIDNIVLCSALNKHSISLKCFCDQSTALAIEDESCVASPSSNGTILYKSGCQCQNPILQPHVVQEVFITRIYVARCLLTNNVNQNISIESINSRKKRDVTDSSMDTVTEETWESSTNMELTTLEESTTIEITTELLSTSTMQESTTELTTSEEPSTTSEEPSTTAELMTTLEEESSTESSTRRTTTAIRTSSTSRASNVTVIPIILTTTESNGEINFGACNSTSFSKKDKQTAEIMLYLASGWVIFWILLTILINIWCHSWGHHRFLDLLQEFGLLAAFVFMGFFVLRPDFTGVCKATRIVLQFSLIYFLLNTIFQAFFLNGLIKGRSTKNSCIPWVFNYTLPLAIAAGATAGFYFWMKDDYDGNDVHCFCEIYTDLYWTFVFPGWAFGFFAVFFNQTSITACKMSRTDVNLDQLFWAKKMCRALPILTGWFCMCFFLLLFGIDMQRTWIIGVYMGLSMLFGPILFVCHTFCYEKTSIKMFTKTGMTFYKPCPQKKSEVVETDSTKVDLRARHPMTDPIISVKGQVEKAELPPQPVGSLSTLSPPMDSQMQSNGVNGMGSNLGPLEYDPTSAQDLYDWLTDKKNTENFNDAENVLFKKNV